MAIAKTDIKNAIKPSMLYKFFFSIFSYIDKRKYEVLLLSFILLIFGNTFSFGKPFIGIMDIYQNFIIGFIVFYNKKTLRIFILCIIILTVVMDIFQNSLFFINVKSWHGILYLIFFSLVTKEVYKEVLYVKTVSKELPAAVLCGFVLLCLIATFLFYQIDIHQPHSFSNTGEGKDILTNLNYFSFTTLLTVGYGDITPVSLVAKRAVMLMGLMGHFYTVFITSIIIGKYLSAKKV
jgi:voltage-gated potassium channel